jgi:hypothetical protein
MYAPLGQRWSLARVCWWGGWAAGKKCDTLMRYLLDELHMYKEGHGDALRPLAEDQKNTFLGEGVFDKPVTVGEFRLGIQQINNLQAHLENAIKHGILKALARASPEHRNTTPAAPAAPATAPAAPATAPAAPATAAPPPTTPQRAGPQEARRTLLPALLRGQSIPDIRRGIDTYRTVLKQWLEGDPSKGLTIPLKNWPAKMRRGDHGRTAGGVGQKYHERAVIAQEYERIGDAHAFAELYCTAGESVAAVLKAIHKARRARGDMQQRQKQK